MSGSMPSSGVRPEAGGVGAGVTSDMERGSPKVINGGEISPEGGFVEMICEFLKIVNCQFTPVQGGGRRTEREFTAKAGMRGGIFRSNCTQSPLPGRQIRCGSPERTSSTGCHGHAASAWPRWSTAHFARPHRSGVTVAPRRSDGLRSSSNDCYWHRTAEAGCLNHTHRISRKATP
jgi:hypothetical protein